MEVKTEHRQININDKICELIHARKFHTCNNCHQSILPGESYWCITLAGAGMASLKYPERICQPCFGDFIEKAKESMK